MDDWIKDRVKEENEAIKACARCALSACLLPCAVFHIRQATDTLLRSGRWEDEAVGFDGNVQNCARHDVHARCC